jgi:predicted transcriptional regulator
MPEKRIHCSVTLSQELYEAVKQAAKKSDQPFTVWCREALKSKLLQSKNTD